MEEDNLPEDESPTSLLDAIDTTGISVEHHIAAESAPVKVNVKAGQKRKKKDSNTNQLPRLEILADCLFACHSGSCRAYLLQPAATVLFPHDCSRGLLYSSCSNA